MIKTGLSFFTGKRILLLQGPLGPFFRRLARDLENHDAKVLKVNFNGGDCAFYPDNAIAFTGPMEDWPGFFESLVLAEKIDMVMLFGDCRPIHRTAHQVSHRLGIEIGVFEEGYVRPDYISFELFGVNGHSRLPRKPEFYRKSPSREPEAPMSVGEVFWNATLWAHIYYGMAALLWPFFRKYKHHRPLHIWEGLKWIRALWRKHYYGVKERGIQQKLETELKGRYFLVPLQVYNDAQIFVHSEYTSVDEFIRHVVQSFALNAPRSMSLVIKHHPFDRGYRDYTNLIAALAGEFGISDRLLYIHDLHLPTLLRHARGVVVVNSTVGLSALRHGAPLKACGKAIYDIEGLTFQGDLDEFWQKSTPCDPDLHRRFRAFLIGNTQVNGSFYKRLPIEDSNAGIKWGPSRASVHKIKLEAPQPTRKLRVQDWLF